MPQLAHQNVPQATKVEVVSTAAAAELGPLNSAAAVASRAAARPIGSTLAENIEDQPHNVTRFAVIGERAENRTGRDKTTLMIRLPNQAGSLAKMITRSRNSASISPDRVVPDSRQRRRKNRRDQPSYLFFVDVEGHQSDKPSSKPSIRSAAAANNSTSSAHTAQQLHRELSKSSRRINNCRSRSPRRWHECRVATRSGSRSSS